MTTTTAPALALTPTGSTVTFVRNGKTCTGTVLAELGEHSLTVRWTPSTWRKSSTCGVKRSQLV